MSISDFEARENLCEYGRRLYQRGLVGGVDGNISCRTAEGNIWISPSMACKGFLTPEMLVKLDIQGRPLLDSPYRASSETPMHLRIYQEYPQIRAVIHAHPLHATAMAVAGEDLPGDNLAEGVYFFGDKVHVAPFAQPGTAELGDCALPYVPYTSAILLANHGALAWGMDIQQAFIAMKSIENYFQVYLYTHYIMGKYRAILPEKLKKLNRMHPPMKDSELKS